MRSLGQTRAPRGVPQGIRGGLASAIAAIGIMAAAGPAGAQGSEAAARCLSQSGPAPVESCLTALRYDRNNPDLMSRLGDAMLASNRPGGAFDAYSDALNVRPDMVVARQGRDEAARQVAARAGTVGLTTSAVMVPLQPIVVPYQAFAPQPPAPPVVAALPFDGHWSGKMETRGQRFAVDATVTGGQVRVFYEDSTDRVTLDGYVDDGGTFSGKGFLKDKNKSAGDGGDPLAISGRFTSEAFEGTGSAGSRYTTLTLHRD
jgi:hypothetical protein